MVRALADFKDITQGVPSIRSEAVLECPPDVDLLTSIFEQVETSARAKKAATNCIRAFGSIAEVVSASEDDLRLRGGLNGKLISICRFIHLASVALAKTELPRGDILNSMSRLERYLMIRLGRRSTEQCRLLLLDSKNRLLSDEHLADGGLRFVAIGFREILLKVVAHSATALILVHNHPSGDPTPSSEDVSFTSQLMHVVGMIGVSLHDHIIVSRSGLISMRSLGLLG